MPGWIPTGRLAVAAAALRLRKRRLQLVMTHLMRAAPVMGCHPAAMLLALPPDHCATVVLCQLAWSWPPYTAKWSPCGDWGLC